MDQFRRPHPALRVIADIAPGSHEEIELCTFSGVTPTWARNAVAELALPGLVSAARAAGTRDRISSPSHIAGATINGAYSLDRHETVGSLEPGKLMDCVLVAGDAIDLIRIGAPSIVAVIKRGRVVCGAGS